MRKQKGNKGIEIGKEEIKLTLFTDDLTVHVENSQRIDKKFLELINK